MADAAQPPDPPTPPWGAPPAPAAPFGAPPSVAPAHPVPQSAPSPGPSFPAPTTPRSLAPPARDTTPLPQASRTSAEAPDHGRPFAAQTQGLPANEPPRTHDGHEHDTGEPGGFDRLSLAVAVLLATLGVLGAFITWRIGQLGSDAEAASRAALAARRERSAAGVEAATQVMRASSQWLGYEIAHRKAEALRAAGDFAEAVRWDREAAAFWGGVPNADIALDGSYDPTAHADALTAAQTDGLDVFAEPHLDAATTAEFKASRLGQIGFWLAAILPFLTLAEITERRRLSILLTAASAAGIGIGAAFVVLAWA